MGPDNEDAHDNREKCIWSLRAQLAAERARTNALIAGLKNAPGRLPNYIQEPLDVIEKARTNLSHSGDGSRVK